ncbi:hypothetical protein EGH82_23325 [Vibrio ponticus]|uniref:Uncharacterized protein n=1 Tax=Vibrio ponticus TaxID=265668 RepID=A0A3N3DQM2_9VIBR|nr:hypothetical protein EGH82_23325 [Vibrio ponticus]
MASVLIFFLTVIFVLNPLMKWQTENKPPVGASENDHFIRVQGLKPIDAQVRATAIFYGGGEECRSFFWSASDGKKRQGAKAVFKIEHDFSPVPDRYELRIPYQKYQSSGCDMTLWQINVGAINAFDDVGFADLRIYPPRMESDKVIGPHSLIEAKNCRARYYDDLQEWSSGLACSFFVDDKMRDKKSDLVIFNAYSVYLNFLQFDDETTIYYDILAGENYRSVPLESKMDE